MNEKTKSALIRFFRVIVPQLPAMFSYFAQAKPEYTALLTFGGAVATALDKFARDSGWY